MIIIKYQKNGKWYLKPKDKLDNPMFYHCATGNNLVRASNQKQIVSLLLIHGVCDVLIEKLIEPSEA